MSSILDQILERIPEERHRDFLRVVNLLNVRPDSPDLVQAYLATEAMAPVFVAMRSERSAIEKTAAQLPAALRGASAEIALAIADRVRDGVVAAVAEHAQEAIARAVVTQIGPIRANVLESAKTWQSNVDALQKLTAASAAQVDAHHQLLAATRRAMVWALGLAFLCGSVIGAFGAHLAGVIH